MEAYENDQYITFPISGLQEVHDNGNTVSHEVICKPVSECLVSDMEEIHGNTIEISDTEAATIHLTEESIEEDIEYESVYVKQEKDQMTSGDDESMAVEALRQLGGMYPYFDEKKADCSDCATPIVIAETENQQKSIIATTSTPNVVIFNKSGKLFCSICNECFDKKVEYNNHMVCHQVDRPHACRICGNLFRTKSSLQGHMNKVHQGTKVHKCTICGVDFQRPSSLSNHMKIHTYVAGRAISHLQNEQKQLESQASTSVVVQNYEWSMPIYSVEDSDDKGNSLQEFTVIPNDEVSQFEYSNQSIGTSINPQLVAISSFENSDSNIKIETVQLNNASILKKVGSSSKDDKVVSPVECEYCDKQFRDRYHLATHQKTCIKRIVQTSGRENGTNWGKHACSECDKKFTTKQKMYRHQWIHRKKTHSCEVCGTQFERQVELDEHRLAAHPGDSPFTCTECGKSFVSRQGLWEHGRTHAGSPAHFHCDKCSKTFTSRQGYLIHHRTHTGERPYGCKFCWKAFRDGGTLRKHERIHTGERPHVCPLCSRAFNQKVVLREHVRWVHAASRHVSDTSGPPFPCPLCGDLNQDRDELCAHIVKHSDKMIAEAKAKVSEPKKDAKKNVNILKKKNKQMIVEIEESPKEIEPQNVDQEQIFLSVAESLKQNLANQNVFVDSKQNTYILVNVGKNSKVHIMSDCDKQNTRVKANAIQICIENPESNRDNEMIELEEKKSTLKMISKKNIETPVLALPNLHTNGNNFSSQIQLVNKEEVAEFEEEDDTEILQVEGIVDENSDDDGDDVVQECRVCGEVGFKGKHELMEHIKMHM